jgi:hypothetical protein
MLRVISTTATKGMDHTMERKSLLKRTWILPVGVAALIGGHVIFFYIVKQSASRILGSGAVISGLVLLVIAKHLGLLAALFRPVYNLFRRRPELRDHASARSLHHRGGNGGDDGLS